MATPVGGQAPAAGMSYLRLMRELRLRPDERVLAWLITGPVGHLVGGVIDWATLLARWGWARARRRGL
ncbi:MAG: hypothetical protein QOF77_640 [Solirubrobacteraceae bacterium]|nr:hypothetical protein [Solirubrobacteraceae bacterium]